MGLVVGIGSAFTLAIRSRDEATLERNDHLNLEDELLVRAPLLAGRALVHDEHGEGAGSNWEARSVGVFELPADADARSVRQRPSLPDLGYVENEIYRANRLRNAAPHRALLLSFAPFAGLALLADVLGEDDADVERLAVAECGGKKYREPH